MSLRRLWGKAEDGKDQDWSKTLPIRNCTGQGDDKVCIISSRFGEVPALSTARTLTDSHGAHQRDSCHW
jgi:hypothetical protein